MNLQNHLSEPRRITWDRRGRKEELQKGRLQENIITFKLNMRKILFCFVFFSKCLCFFHEQCYSTYFVFFQKVQACITCSIEKKIKENCFTINSGCVTGNRWISFEPTYTSQLACSQWNHTSYNSTPLSKWLHAFLNFVLCASPLWYTWFKDNWNNLKLPVLRMNKLNFFSFWGCLLDLFLD
jgi:hypothetical protein